MSRCKSCDVILDTVELKRTNEYTGLPEDLCSSCSKVVFLDVNDLFMEYRDYQFGEITENALVQVGYKFTSLITT